LSVQHGFDLWLWVAGLEMVRRRTAGWRWGIRRTRRSWSDKSYDSGKTNSGRGYRRT
jgi:hypothetical protein